MNNNGFYIMHRGWWENPFLKRDLKRIFAFEYLIANAAFKTHTTCFKGAVYELQRGQLITSHVDLQQNLKPFGFTLKVVRNVLNDLKKGALIGIEADAHGSLITICNYNTYQDGLNKQGITKGVIKGKQEANQGHTKGEQYKQSQTTVNNDNNVITLDLHEIEVNWNTFNSLYPPKKRVGNGFDFFKKSQYAQGEKFTKLLQTLNYKFKVDGEWSKENHRFCPQQNNLFYKSHFLNEAIEEMQAHFANPNNKQVGGF